MGKLMPVNVFRTCRNGVPENFTNGGISGKVDTLYVRNPEGYIDEETAGIDPELIFVEENRGGEYWALTPIVKKPKLCGPMNGGNLAGSSDSRIKHVYHVHDRFETWEQYDALST